MQRVGLRNPVALVAASAAVPAAAASGAVYLATTRGDDCSGGANIGAGIAMIAGGAGVDELVLSSYTGTPSGPRDRPPW